MQYSILNQFRDIRWRRSTQGMTLPEVLVVISIIMLLGGLLFPVFSSARKRAKAVSCTANLAQIHAACALYMADSDDVFPAGKDCLDLYPPKGYSQSIINRVKALPLLPQLVLPYAKSRDIFHCPADDGAAVIESAFPNSVPLMPSAFQKCGDSYEYHTVLGLAGITGSKLQNVSGVNLVEDIAGHWHGSDPAALPEDSFNTFRHKTFGYRYLVAYVDGHVKNVSYRAKEDAWHEE